MSGRIWRIGFIIILIVVACIAIWYTVNLRTIYDSYRTALRDDDPGAPHQKQQESIPLGLDIQDTTRMVLRVKLEELDRGAQEGAVKRVMQVIRNRVEDLGVAEPTIVIQGNGRIIIDLPGYTDVDRAVELIGQTGLLQFKLMETADNANLLLKRMDAVIAVYERGKGSTETSDVSAEGDVVADLLNEGDFPLTSRLKQDLYNGSTGTAWPKFAVNKHDREKIDHWLHLPEVAKLVPVDVQWSWSTRSEIRDNREVNYLYLVKRKVLFLGKFLEDIAVVRDQIGGFVINFSLSGDGASRFAQLTGANIGKPLAILLDNRVESAPFINSKIRRRGQISLGASASIEDARNLEIVLKTGALPAPVEIIEKNVVGATLGADSTRKDLENNQ